MPFNGATHRSRAVGWVVAFLDEEILRFFVEINLDASGLQAFDDLGDLKVDDPDEVRFREGVENNEVVEAVDELRFQHPFRLFEDFLTHHIVLGLVALRGTEAHDALFLDEFRADVGCQDDDGVPEVDFSAERIGDFALFEDLQKEVEHVGVRLFYLIEQHDGVRAAPHCFGELSAFFVADVSWRRADEARRGELLHVLGHVDLDECFAITEHEFGEALGEEGFSDAGGAEEDKGADWASGIFEVGSGSAKGFGDRDHGFVLTDDLAFELVLHLEKLLGLRLFHPVEGNAGPFGDDVHDVIFRHGNDFLFAMGFPFFEDSVEFLFCLFFGVPKCGGAFEVLVFDGGFLVGPDGFDLFLEFFDVWGAGHCSDSRARTGFIHDVDGFVWEESTGEVTVGEFCCGLEGIVAVTGFVVGLVFWPEAVEDLDGLFDGGGFDFDLLETAFECGVFLDVFAVFVECGGADALHFPAAEGGFDDVRGVHGAFGGSCSHDGVELIDEEDHVFRAPDLVHHGFDPLFELAAVFRACDHEGEVEGDDLFVPKDFRNIPCGDLLGEALDDGGFSDACFPDEDGIVFGAATEHLDYALDFVFASDDGVHFPFLG